MGIPAARVIQFPGVSDYLRPAFVCMHLDTGPPASLGNGRRIPRHGDP
jgi:hypothetical protein